ncbi:MAG: quinohemoprotein ethanol dehydrogenase [Arenicella sp.]|jgi:quinohemoprotein ethanol dehydrogenase
MFFKFSVQGGMMALPIAYELDGIQYVAVAQGWGARAAYPLVQLVGRKICSTSADCLFLP